MSQWTHINAVIRYDCMRIMGQTLPDLSLVPSGSEGPMHVQIYQNPSTNSLAAYTVMFWGDLRDYHDGEEIMNYFKSVTKGQMIRSGLVEIDIEGRSVQTFRYNNEKSEWEYLVAV